MQDCETIQKIENNTFTSLTKLQQVEFKNNKHLKTIEAGAFQKQNSSVSYLDLYDNALEKLPADLLNWSRVEVWNLGENMWVCDCDMAWVKHTDDISVAVKHTMT